MTNLLPVRSVSFDTSFLLKDTVLVDNVVAFLQKENVLCTITQTVLSELEQLKVWGRISSSQYRKAIKRLKKAGATIIDFKNRLLSDAYSKACVDSMYQYHGVEKNDIVNDCRILITALKNGVDVFLSEDFHFTSRITQKVIAEVTHAACVEYQQMCSSDLYSVDVKTFLQAYQEGMVDIDIIVSRMKAIRKKGKRI